MIKMKAIIAGFRRGVHTYKPRHFIIEIENSNKESSLKLIGKTITWKSPAGKKITGKISALHGNKGLLRAIFEKGLPGQAINTEAEIN